MRLGLFLSAHFEPGSDVARESDAVVEQAVRAEELGFDSVFLGHHYLARSAFLQPVPLLAHLAAHTRRVRLGLGVHLLPLSHPVTLAEELSTLDVLSGGRLIAGFGTGYREVEYRAVGVPFDERYQRLEESVALLRRLWAGETVTAEGHFGELDGARLHLEPVAPGGPPIWLGAFGPIGIRRAARLGASWLAAPEGDGSDLAERLALYRSELVHHGQPLEREYPLMREAFVAPTRERAIELAGPYLTEQYANYRAWDHGQGDEDLLGAHSLIGTPDDVLAGLAAYGELGITDVVMRQQWMGMPEGPVRESLDLLGRHVIPAL